MPLNSEHTEASFSPNSTYLFCSQLAQVPRSADLAIFVSTTTMITMTMTTRLITLPLTHVHGVTSHTLLTTIIISWLYMYMYMVLAQQAFAHVTYMGPCVDKATMVFRSLMKSALSLWGYSASINSASFIISSSYNNNYYYTYNSVYRLKTQWHNICRCIHHLRSRYKCTHVITKQWHYC